MPLTGLEFPILTRFLCAVETMTGLPPQPLDASTQQQQPQAQGQSKQEDGDKPKPLPKGIVLGPDGKPYVPPLSKPCGHSTLLLEDDVLI